VSKIKTKTLSTKYLKELEKQKKTLKQLSTEVVIVTMDEFYFSEPHQDFSKIFDKNGEITKKNNLDSKILALVIENNQIVNYETGTDEINFPKLIIGKGNNSERNIQGRTSIHVEPTFLLPESRTVLSDENCSEEKTPRLLLTQDFGDSVGEETLEVNLDDIVISTGRGRPRNYSVVKKDLPLTKSKSVGYLDPSRYESKYEPMVLCGEDSKKLKKSNSHKDNSSGSITISNRPSFSSMLKSSSIGQFILKLTRPSEDKIKEKRENFVYSDIYKDQNFQYFKMFLASEYSVENALFLESVKIFKSLKSKSKKDLFAKKLVTEYFEDNSLKELNVPEKLKVQIPFNVRIGKITNELFDDVVQDLEQGIIHDSFSRFKKSTYFNEMIENSLK
jgi:hypothetical protein